jgi:hypothetical protein
MSKVEMLRAIREKVAVDISGCEQTKEGWYKLLDKKLVDFDLCDVEKGRWIRSVGMHLPTGDLFAATTENAFFPPKLDWACVWVR